METDGPRDVYLSGTENIFVVQDLIDRKDSREEGAGYTTRIAVKTAYVALRAPGHKVVIADTEDSREARYRLLQLVQGILDYLRVDYDVGTQGKLASFGMSDMWVRVTPLPDKTILPDQPIRILS